MNSLRKLNSLIRSKTHKRKLRDCSYYIYTPLPDNKFGYIIEYRRPNFSEIFYYKYKKNADGTLTKYGYLVSDPGIGFGHSNHINNKRNRGLWANKDKDCIFYQTVADKTQIELEYRWMNEIRNKGRLEIYPDDYDNNVNYASNSNNYNNVNNEWADVMQHNNKIYISDNIQRRRVAEVLEKFENICDEVKMQSTKTTFNKKISPDSDNKQFGSNSLNQLPQLKTIDILPPILQSTTLFDTETTASADNELSSDVTSEFSPPITPPSSPSEMYSSVKPNGLLNMNIRQRHLRTSSKDSTKSNSSQTKPQKILHLSHPKFSKKPPVVHIFDPEDSLLFKNCKCDHCIIGGYNE